MQIPTSSHESGSRPAGAGDRAYQQHILPRVSRTFALTIPELPEGLREVVANGYLLCRIADTLEDDPDLEGERKRVLQQTFTDLVAGGGDPDAFAAEVVPCLSAATPADELDLIAHTAAVIRLTRSFSAPCRAALERCVRVMCAGMPDFQAARPRRGLDDIQEMHRYCYYVAGVVGEMLTDLFCAHAADIDAQGAALRRRAVSFGQGLQMTNILKDIWDDLQRGFCWLPGDLFHRAGVDLDELAPGRDPAGVARALGELIAIAHQHLRDALDYTLILPARHAGIRRFCLRAVGMAVLTLRKINRHRDFTATRQVKISRRSVAAVVAVTDRTAQHDRLLRALFALISTGLPAPRGNRVEWEGAPIAR
ncbi:MAG: phytoene/squalene synthase family protein [Acidobacteriota bacterium]